MADNDTLQVRLDRVFSASVVPNDSCCVHACAVPCAGPVYYRLLHAVRLDPLSTPPDPPILPPSPIPSPSRPLSIRNLHHLHTVPIIQSSAKKFQQQSRPFVFVLGVESQGVDENKCWIESVLTDVGLGFLFVSTRV